MISERVVGSYFSISKVVCSICFAIVSISLSLEANSTIIKPGENEVLETIENIFFSKNNSEKNEKMLNKLKSLDYEFVRSGSSIKEIEGRDIYMSLYRQLQNGSDDKEHDFYHYAGEDDLDYYLAKGNLTNTTYMLGKDPDNKDITLFKDGWNMLAVANIIQVFRKIKKPLSAIYAISYEWLSSGGMFYDDIIEKRWKRTDTQPNDALANEIIKRSVFR